MVCKLSVRRKHIVPIYSCRKSGISRWIYERGWVYCEFWMIIYNNVLRIRIYVIVGWLYRGSINLALLLFEACKVLIFNSRELQPKWILSQDSPFVPEYLTKHGVQCDKLSNIHLVNTYMTIKPNIVKISFDSWHGFLIISSDFYHHLSYV